MAAQPKMSINSYEKRCEITVIRLVVITAAISRNGGIRYLSTYFRDCGEGLPQFEAFARWFKALDGPAVDDCPRRKSPHQINAGA